MTIPHGCVRCDRCHDISPVYADWPTCRECDSRLCPACTEPHTLHEADLDDPATAVCVDCQPENPRERDDDDGVEYGDPRDEMEDRLLRD